MTDLFHPLCGSNLKTLLSLLTTNGGIAPNRFPQTAIALAFTLARLPFSTTERVLVNLTRSQREPIQAPIFIRWLLA